MNTDTPEDLQPPKGGPMRAVRDLILESIRVSVGQLHAFHGPERTQQILHLAQAHAELDRADSARRTAYAAERVAARAL